ncbi:hypothetical protein [Winogradskyella ouciana]|uniref:Uncharacterized protein n=1 Tax=Winogradskyella ouciana TaxID=2608631 RepID=A0A7K1G972_9FLAO|nr:hypothetical protein [Winogradskyella ouciana]MTE25820.1 hypothetical protein [Winogradskyella ouciana]
MKKISKFLLLAVLVIFASCQKESTEDQALEERQAELRFDKDGNVVSDGEEDKELIFNENSEILNDNTLMNVGMSNLSTGGSVAQVYNVIDADRAPNSNDGQPISNMWWSITGTDYDSPSSYYSAVNDDNMVFTEYTDGSAHLVGTTVSGTCVVDVDVWFINKKTWAEWQAIGGGHKKEGTAGDASNSEDMNFYVIDETRSTLTANGGDCDLTGTFGLTQRPDPNDPSTPNFGAHVGPGGANYDSNIGALGLSTWGWITDLSTGELLYIMDFNFRLELDEEECNDCIGDVTDLTLNWDWHNDYRVRVYQRYENTWCATKIFDSVVGANENFTINGANADGTFGKYVYIYVGNCYYTKIKTNCWLNIGPGYRRGVIEVVSGHSSQGGELCEYDPPQYWCWWW